jgi:hypothetical protein
MTDSEDPRGQTVRISVTEAKGQLTELVRRAEAGDMKRCGWFP